MTGPGGVSDGLRADPPQGTRVTATDLATGESETVEIRDDYVVTCDGRSYVDGVQAYANGTHIVTIKREPAPCAVPVGDTPPSEQATSGDDCASRPGAGES